jgi:hippurate hydrolase
MSEIDNIKSFHDELVAWRRDLHAHPEMAYKENRTSAFVADKLRSWGIEVHTGLAKTGVVGTVRNGTGNRAVGLRADMDALPLHELNNFAHRSQHDGVMHACGHDGHTVMLLGAARHLAKHRDFDGTVHLIFQPAEEGEGGGKLMIEEGLFEKFPCDAVFGLHNLPGIPVGKFAVRSGPLLASSDKFEITIAGTGSHGAFPHQGVDPVLIACEVVTALQGIVTRNVDPLQSAVISVTQINGGSAYNIIPGEVKLGGTTRAFTPEVQKLIEQRMRQVVEGICAAHNAKGTLKYIYGYPPTINSADEAGIAAAAAAKVVGQDNVLLDHPPSMAADDVAFMLNACSGAHIQIGNGVGPGVGEGGCAVHNPNYDFNDKILSLGASFWVRVAETFLAQRAA